MNLILILNQIYISENNEIGYYFVFINKNINKNKFKPKITFNIKGLK